VYSVFDAEYLTAGIVKEYLLQRVAVYDTVPDFD
jgi:hypothetical protein